MQVLYAYLNGEETLEAALTAWRRIPCERLEAAL